MRCLKRNQRRFYYALYLGEEDILDEYGRRTGESKLTYGEVTEMRANISAGTGEAQAEQFGNAIAYDKVIVVDDPDCPIDENTVLCVDVLPTYNTDGALVYDYIVKKAARSLNSVSYAVKRVDIS